MIKELPLILFEANHTCRGKIPALIDATSPWPSMVDGRNLAPSPRALAPKCQEGSDPSYGSLQTAKFKNVDKSPDRALR